MLPRKRGALRARVRKMKKAAGAVLQTDVTSDDEWAKLLQREGLLLVDIYSDWSGPCTGMISVLKKIKMETGGDILSYATAKCDNITSLSRFRGKSEPAWMFIHAGKMINFMFGANCPKLVELLIKEIKRVKSNQQPEFAIPVQELSPAEIERIRAYEEQNAAANAEKLAQEDLAREKMYEAELNQLVNSLQYETCIILFPWMFKDEEGNDIERSASPSYVELIQQVLPQQFKIEEEVIIEFDDTSLETLVKESVHELSSDTKNLILNGECLGLRLKRTDKLASTDIDDDLVTLVYGEAVIAETPNDLSEGCFIERNLPALPQFAKDTCSVSSSTDKPLVLTTVWVPFNPRNRALVFRALFPKYIEATYPFEDPEVEIPITLFKFDNPRRMELESVMKKYKKEVLNFGVFEDTLPNPKLISISFAQYEDEINEKTGNEAFVCVIKKINNEAFLSFAGIGPYHISENPEIAKEEANLYFPNTEEDENENNPPEE